jgi:predicted transcriptional regulator
MNYKSYKTTIVNKHGGLNKEALEKDINKLLEYHENHLINIWLTQRNEINKHYNNPVKEIDLKEEHDKQEDCEMFVRKYCFEDLKQSIDNIMKANLADYDKALGILRIVKHTNTWQKFEIIPDEIFHATWALIDSMKNIELHPEEEGLFRVR